MVYTRTVGETPDIGAHLIDFDLDYDIGVFVARPRARRQPDSSGRGRAGRASCRRRVPSPTAPSVGDRRQHGGCAAPLSPMGPGETRKPRPNDSAIVRAVAGAFPGALRNSCQEHGGSWEFMDRAVDALRAKDGRYGYNCKRGNCNDPSLDVASYFYADHGATSRAAPRSTSST